MTAEWVRVDLDAVEKYGADGAVVLGLIAYRCNPTGEWPATLEMLVGESRLTTHRVRAALRVLRDTGAVESRRADRFRPHLTWTVSPGHTVNQESLITRLRDSPSPEMQESGLSSSTEEEELPLVVPAPEKPTKKPTRATRLPEDFRPKQAHFDLASELGVDLRHEGPQFRDYHVAKGSTMKDWDAALRTWIRNAAKFAAQRGDGPVRALPAVPAGETYDAAHAASLPPPLTEPRSWGVGR